MFNIFARYERVRIIIGVCTPLLLIMNSPAEARKVLLHCTKQAPGSITLTYIWEVDFDRSTVKDVSSSRVNDGKEMRADISLQWITWHYPRGWEQIDRFTGDYKSHSEGSGRFPDWNGHCTMTDGPLIR